VPVYEYECAGCKRRFELRRAMTEEDTGILCPKCGAGNPRRIFSVFGMASSGSAAQSSAAEQATCESCTAGGQFT